VVITGDNHTNWVNEVRSSGSSNQMVAAEFVGTSISSEGDGSERSDFFTNAVAAENPHVKWNNKRRGYVMCHVAPEEWRTEFRTVQYVTRPDASVETPSRWRLTRGRPEIVRE
jgi:alkaline phosphatase D